MNDKGLLRKSELKKCMPDHNPIWTCVGVTKLAKNEMKVEIEVVAHDPR
jgi:enamine deaminase RidA (YjgF/YER057c/UK114 family)